jgi:hypothetical protein
MPFRLRKDANEFFENVSKQKGQRGFELSFDIYYLCLLAGLATRRKKNLPDEKTAEMVDDFPKSYKEKSRLIIALFLRREIADSGILLEDKKLLHGFLRKLIDPDKASKLSDEGMRKMNEYSNAGLEVIMGKFDPPHFLETFLPSYYSFIGKISNEN